MNEIQLYKLLQQSVGVLNKLAVDLYSGLKDSAVALPEARACVDELKAQIDPPTV